MPLLNIETPLARTILYLWGNDLVLEITPSKSFNSSRSGRQVPSVTNSIACLCNDNNCMSSENSFAQNIENELSHATF